VGASEQSPGEQIAGTMSRIWQAGMTTASGGNISLRDTGGRIWTTPRGIDKGGLTGDDIVSVSTDGSSENRFGNLPTTELSFHEAIYRKRKDLKAIIHAHPPALSSFSFARKVPDTSTIPHVRELCGNAGYAPYQISGSDELAESVSEEFKKGHQCVIMENHAVVTGGETLLEAFQRFEAFEFCARAIINARKIAKYEIVPDTPEYLESDQPDLKEYDQVHSPPDEAELRSTICKYITRACRHQLMLSSYGTLSARWREHHLLITPDCRDRSKIEPGDIVQIKNGWRESGKTPDPAVRLHMEIYDKHPEVMSIMTAGAPCLMAFGICDVPMDIRTSPEGYVLLRNISRVPYRNPRDGTNLNQIVQALRRDTPCIMIANDSLLVTGGSILQAYERLEVAEFTARSLIDAIPVGKAKPIDPHHLNKLKEKFLS